jgi:hypothetical protein
MLGTSGSEKKPLSGVGYEAADDTLGATAASW